MSKKLFKIISEVMNVPLSEINDNSGAETLQEWDSFKMYVLINEIEKEFNIKLSDLNKINTFWFRNYFREN